MKRCLHFLVLLVLPGVLQGCILLMPVIERNQAAERERLSKAEKKPCFLTGEERQAGARTLSDISELHAFVAAHRSSPRMTKSQRLERLVSQLRGGSEVARTHAATDIGLMKGAAKSAVPALAHALRYDESKWVRRASVKSLAKISGKEVLDPIKRALQDQDKWVAHSAHNALRKVRAELSRTARPQVQPIVYRGQ